MATSIDNFDRAEMNADQKAIWLTTYSTIFSENCMKAGTLEAHAAYAAHVADMAVKLAPLDTLSPSDDEAPIVRGPCPGRG